MSARVAWGRLAPAGKPHPATKWSLLMVLLVVVVLGVPNRAVASPPSVNSPTGPESGGVFTGTYTFGTYISCSGGLNFSSSYSSSLDGTHTFRFWGAADGSLLLSIDGGGLQLVTSCGDPLTGPNVNVANFTVSKNTAPPPTPTPTPPPTPAPTPTPTPAPTPSGGGGGGTTGGGTSGGGSSGGGSSGGSSGSTVGSAPGAQTPAPAAGSAATPAAVATPVPAGGTAATPHPAATHPKTVRVGTSEPAASTHLLALANFGFGGLLLLAIVFAAWRSRRFRDLVEPIWRRLAIRAEPYIFRLRQFARRHIHVHAIDLPKRRGLSHHHHSGKLIAHHHTSYPALGFLLLLSGILSAGVSFSSHADSQLSLTVLGPPPTVGATIDQPVQDDRFAVSTQTVRGTCPLGLMVEIYRNGTFAGSTLCDSGGLYNLIITLVPGQNDLIARDLDALSQYGPDSATVTVFYDAPIPTPTPTPPPTPIATPTGPVTKPTPKPVVKATPKPTPAPAPAPFYLDSSSHYFQGASPSDPVNWQLQIHGGHSPYEVSWEWGDGHVDTSTAAASGAITGTHQYDKPGTYHITVRAHDAQNREAVMSLLAIVNGAAPAAATRPSEPTGNLVFIWPILIITSIMVMSFWLGERHKLAITDSPLTAS